MRLSSVFLSALGCAGAASTVAIAACTLDKGTGTGPAPQPGDGSVDTAAFEVGADARRDAIGSDTPAGFDGPPPIEDTGVEDFGTTRPPGEHVEALIGPDGGTLSGADGTPLVHVSLVIPAGALATTTLMALDLDRSPPPGPTGSVAVTPYVRVGPDATSFAVPARFTMPYTTTAATPLLVMVGRAGVSWSALLDPRGDTTAVTLSAEMKRASPAAGFLVTMTVPPKPTGFSPDHAAVGDIVFLEGTSFGVGPAWRAAGDGGAELTSSLQVGTIAATPLAWSDTAISFRVPAGSTGGAIAVNGPAGSGSTTGSLTVP